ncbi:MAG: ABC transporter ATP-binding protein [Bacteroidia bacterium]
MPHMSPTDPTQLTPILRVRGLQAGFPDEHRQMRTVVHGLDFDLHAGRTLGIVGESGSGKSVTALSLMRLLSGRGRIVGGQVLYQPPGQAAVDLLSLPEHVMRRYRGRDLAMVFQEPMTALNPVHRCGPQVAEVLRIHLGLSRQEAHARVLDLFGQVELPDVARIYRAYPHQLSGGQKQRVLIAMAIACDPRVLIADEPTTAIDVMVQQHILALIQRLQDTHRMGIVFITHDLGVVAEVADEVLVMHQGQAVEYGPVRQIFEAPQHPYTQGLLACRPRMDRSLRRLPTVDDFLQRRAVVVGEPTPPKPPTAQPLLRVEALHTHFPGQRQGLWRRSEPKRAVDGVSFEVYPGETLGLVGESGCGKTTLGRSVLRLIEPQSGAISYAGRDLIGLDAPHLRQLRRELQIIFQDPYSSLNPRMPVGRAIEEVMAVHDIGRDAADRKARTLALLDKVGLLPEHYDRYPDAFSGGQRQRVCIARSLATSPRFVVCDESVSALDVSVQAQVLNLLKDLQADLGLTYLFISHDLSVVKFMSDRIMVMREGRIEEQGSAAQIYTQPQSAYTQALIAAVPPGTKATIDAALTRRAARHASA